LSHTSSPWKLSFKHTWESLGQNRTSLWATSLLPVI
jgi:hypothetical protein